MDIVDRRIEEYLLGITPPSHEVLQEMEARAEREQFPIVGRLVGRLLAQLTSLIQARLVYELGSGYGYSAAWFAQAIQPDGKVYCTDFSESNRNDAKEYLTRLGLWERVEYQVGDAIRLFEQEKGPFDIVYLDLHKTHYPQALELAIPRLRQGGLIIADNVLFHGKVVEDVPGEMARGILEYNRRVLHDPGLETTILPLRDGVAVSRKL